MHIGEKLDAIYRDLSANVTRIYERDNVHLAIDLVYHSPLSFYFGNRFISKGNVECLIVGDTRCGKSETADRLLQHYKLGAISSGENTSFSGLVGGLQQIHGRWTITWGKIPLNHKRLLIIDEVSGLPVEDIANMSQIRSSGVAEITKIQTERTLAKARLVWLSNPRTNRAVNDFNSGVELIRDVIGKPEDIARFDFAIVVAKGDVNYANIPNRDKEKVPHTFTSDLCRDLILWCWSRSPEQVKFSAATMDACYEHADALCDKYSSDCPIVNASEQKIKLARMAAGLAGRLFSTSDGDDMVVLPAHVEYVARFLDTEYSRPAFGYDIFSNQRREDNNITDFDKVMEVVHNMGIPVAKQLLDTNQIKLQDIEELMGCDRDQAKSALSTLLKLGAFNKRINGYVKTAAFISLLKGYITKKIVVKEEF